MASFRVRTAAVEYEEGGWGVMMEVHDPDNGEVDRWYSRPDNDRYDTKAEAMKAASDLGRKLREEMASELGVTVLDWPSPRKS